MGAKRLGGKRLGGKRLGGETTRGRNGLGAKRPGFICPCSGAIYMYMTITISHCGLAAHILNVGN